MMSLDHGCDVPNHEEFRDYDTVEWILSPNVEKADYNMQDHGLDNGRQNHQGCPKTVLLTTSRMVGVVGVVESMMAAARIVKAVGVVMVVSSPEWSRSSIGATTSTSQDMSVATKQQQ